MAPRYGGAAEARSSINAVSQGHSIFPNVIASAAWQSGRHSTSARRKRLYRSAAGAPFHYRRRQSNDPGSLWLGLTIIAKSYNMYFVRWGSRDTPLVTNRRAIGPVVQEVGSGFADNAEP